MQRFTLFKLGSQCSRESISINIEERANRVCCCTLRNWFFKNALCLSRCPNSVFSECRRPAVLNSFYHEAHFVSENRGARQREIKVKI